MNRLTHYRKFIAAVIGAIVTILATQDVSVDPEIAAAVTTLVTAVAVLLIPNEVGVRYFDEDIDA